MTTETATAEAVSIHTATGHPKPRRKRRLALLLALSMTTAACGSSTASLDETPESSESDVGSELETSATTDGGLSSESTESSTTSTEATESTTTTASTAPEEVGEALDFFPPIGTVFSVVGVRWDDDLNFRSAPGTSNPVLDNVTSIDVGHTITGLGQAWQFTDSIWWKVNVDGTEAWASQRFLAAPGQTDDIFDEVAAELGVLKAVDMEDLADMVAGTRHAGDPAPRVIIVAEPLAFEGVGAFITIDILDFGDDALKGERLEITAALVYEDEESDEPIVDFVVLEGVQRTILCGRGVSEGLCL